MVKRHESEVHVRDEGSENLAGYLSREPSSDESDSEEEPVISEVVSETVSMIISETIPAVVSEVVFEVESENEMSDTQPQPPESEDETPRLVARIHNATSSVPRAKPEWWTEAWDCLEGTQSGPGIWIQPVCPLEFKDEVHMDVSGFDQPGWQSHTDLTTGETILPSEGNERLGGVTGVIWSAHHVTMTRCADRNVEPGVTCLRNFS
jgi:hypothetical protein